MQSIAELIWTFSYYLIAFLLRSRINTHENLSTEPAESCSTAAELPVSCCLEHDAWLFWNWKTRTSWFDLNSCESVGSAADFFFFGVRHGVRISCWLASGRRGRCRAGNVCTSQVVQLPLKTCSSWPIGFVQSWRAFPAGQVQSAPAQASSQRHVGFGKDSWLSHLSLTASSHDATQYLQVAGACLKQRWDAQDVKETSPSRPAHRASRKGTDWIRLVMIGGDWEWFHVSFGGLLETDGNWNDSCGL